jgi:hypothetical protein
MKSKIDNYLEQAINTAVESLVEAKIMPSDDDILQIICYNRSLLLSAKESNIFENKDNSKKDFTVHLRSKSLDNLEDILEIFRHFVYCKYELEKAIVPVNYLGKDSEKCTKDHITFLNERSKRFVFKVYKRNNKNYLSILRKSF